MPSRAEWLAEAPFNLALGAGFFGFFAHAGLLAALEARGLAPQRVVGVSAGALAGGVWASGVPAAAIGETLCALRRDDFWDPGVPLGGLLRGRKFTRKLREVLAPGVRVIEDCRVPFAAVAHDVLRRRTVVMDRGPLDTAIVASCTVPLMFRPVLARGTILVDGGVSDRDGVSALPAGQRTLMHHLPSRRRLPRPAPSPTAVPDRPGLFLVTPDLPKVTPFALHHGPLALQRARTHAERWLDEEV